MAGALSGREQAEPYPNALGVARQWDDRETWLWNGLTGSEPWRTRALERRPDAPRPVMCRGQLGTDGEVPAGSTRSTGIVEAAADVKRKRRTRRLLDWYQGEMNADFAAVLLSFVTKTLCIVKSYLTLILDLHPIFVLLSRLFTELIVLVYKFTCILLVDYFWESPYFGRQRSFVPCRVP